MNFRMLFGIGAVIVMSVFHPSVAETGSILREYWTGISGTTVSALTGSGNFPDNPSGHSFLTSYLEIPTNWGDNYGTRVRGFIHPPTNGEYVFWIASDDNSELWLSTDDKPSNKILIASVNGYTNSREWYKFGSQQSSPVTLSSGSRYYIEVLHKDGDQNDNCAVGWMLPDSTLEQPIPASRLSPVTDDEDYSDWNFTSTIIMNTTVSGANVSQNVLKVPVLVRLSESNFDFSSARADGSDLRFSKTDGSHFYYQIEQWDILAQIAAVWVRVDTVFGNDSTQSITMHWGKSDAVSRSDGAAVFDTAAGFRGVWHMEQVPPDTIRDATINRNNGTVHGNMGASNSVGGAVGKALRFNDSTSDYCNMGNSTTLQISGEVTLSAWIKTGVNDTFMGICGKIILFPGKKGFSLHKYTTNVFRFHTANGSTQELLESNTGYADSNWHYIAGVRRGSANYLYVDGVQQTATGSLAFSDDGSFAAAGKQYTDYEGRYWDGLIDEMRIDSKGRSADWIKLCYENQKEGSVFLSIEPADTKPLVSLVPDSTEITESSGTVTAFTVSATIGAPADSPVVVVVPFSYSGTANSGTDYLTLPSSVTLTIVVDSLQATTPVYFTPVDDTIDEGNEYIVASIVADTTFHSGNPDSIVLTIVDDDVRFPPQITVQPAGLTLLEGETGTFSVDVEGSEPFTYIWRKDGTPVASAPNSGTYIIPPAPYSDSGVYYSCIVTNGVGSDTSDNALLSVSVRPELPRILRQPLSQVVAEGDTATFNVMVAGTPPFLYRWYCDTTLLGGETDTVLRTGPAMLLDNGKRYYCVIENDFGSITSSYALLTVRKPSSQTMIISGDLFTSGYSPVGYQNEVALDFKVELYPGATGGTPLYTETFYQSDNKAIMVKNGKFALQLGEGNSDNDLMDVVRTNANLFVAFTISRPGGNPELLDRRVPLTASPYALSSLPQLLKGSVNPDSANIEAPIGTHYLNTAADSTTYIRTAKGWVALE